jgi:hypothetical protein
LLSLVGVRSSVDSINILDDGEDIVDEEDEGEGDEDDDDEDNDDDDDDDDDDDGRVRILELLVGTRASARLFAGRRDAATATRLRREDFIVIVLFR